MDAVLPLITAQESQGGGNVQLQLSEVHLTIYESFYFEIWLSRHAFIFTWKEVCFLF